MQRGFGYQNRRNAGFSPASLFAGGTVNGAWYDPSDSTTLFTDRAGTTPCGTPGGGSVVPVGAMLDKRAAGYSVFFDGTGDNLETPNSAAFQFGTGDFTVEGWIYVTGALTGYRVIAQCAVNLSWAAGWTLNIRNDQLDFWANGSSIAISAAGSITANTWIHVAATRSGTNVRLWINGSSAATATSSADLQPTRAVSIGDQTTASLGFPFQGYISNLRIVKGTAVYTGAFTPSGPLSPIAGTSLLTCGTSWTGNPAITKNGDARVDGLNPFTASPVGNHAIAANDTTARPELRARVNLLTFSEQFDNAAWDKLNGVTVSQNAAVAPDGTTTADKLIAPNSTGTVRAVRQALTSGVNGVSYVSSFYAKYVSGEFAWVRALATDAGVVWFDIQNGVRGTVTGVNTTGTITPVGNGWYRCVITSTASSINIYSYLNPVDADGSTTTTGDGSKGVLIWGAQLTATNEFPANTYQRISDANTYDAVGFPRYLAFNGTSSAMSTPGNVNLSGTDKATVFLGLRKANDASAYVPLEFSNASGWTVANGSFAIYAPSYLSGSFPAPKYFVGLRGSNQRQEEFSTFTAPISNVLAESIDIGAAVGSEISMRINGAVIAPSVAVGDAGSGNLGNYPLTIGVRSTGTNYFPGNLYSLIVVGSAVSAGQISATEQWVAGKTGIAI